MGLGNKMRRISMPSSSSWVWLFGDFVWKHSLFHHIPLLVGCLNISQGEREREMWWWREQIFTEWKKQIVFNAAQLAWLVETLVLKIWIGRSLFLNENYQFWRIQFLKILLSFVIGPSNEMVIKSSFFSFFLTKPQVWGVVDDKSQTPTCWGCLVNHRDPHRNLCRSNNTITVKMEWWYS